MGKPNCINLYQGTEHAHEIDVADGPVLNNLVDLAPINDGSHGIRWKAMDKLGKNYTLKQGNDMTRGSKNPIEEAP